MAESLNVFDSGAFLVMIQSTKDAGVILLERPKGRVARSSHQAAAEMLPEQRSRRKVPGQQWGRRHGRAGCNTQRSSGWALSWHQKLLSFNML